MKEKTEFFIDKNKPSMNELIYWFLVNFPALALDMRDCSHAVKTDEPNPYHIEGDIFCHTMLVCQRAEIDNVSKVNKICALLHDIGKPESMEELPFNKPKPIYTESNEIRNNSKNDGKTSGLNNKVPKSGLKRSMRGHEGISFYLAIEVVNELEKIGVLNKEEKQDVLVIISKHGSLFDSIDSEGNMKKPYKVYDKFFSIKKAKMLSYKVDVSNYTLSVNEIKEYFKKEIDLFNNFVTQVLCDSTGRFFTSKDGRKNNAFKLGKEIFTEDQFIDYIVERIKKIQGKSKSEDNPTITVLVGPPACGKTSFMNNSIYKKSIIEVANEFERRNNK